MKAEQQKEVHVLQQLNGEEFDRAYTSLMMIGHHVDVTDFKDQATNGRGAQVKALATSALPDLEQHLSLAITAENQVVTSGT